jgi:hypothetical protein
MLKFHVTFSTVLSLVAIILGQEASDYYGRHVQELQEKIWVKDTVLAHVGGYPQCFNEVYQWSYKQRDPRFKSLASVDSLGVTQIVLHSDCQKLRSFGPVRDYYMAMTSKSKYLKIEFWNIDPKSKDCDAGFRKSIIKGLTDLLSSFVDSTKYVHVPCKGFVIEHPVAIRYNTHIDSVTERLFEALRADSVRRSDSITHAPFVADSIAKVAIAARPKIEVVIDTAVTQKEIDSISKVIGADSILIHRRDLMMFKGQPMISCQGKINIPIRLECLDFLSAHKLRTNKDIMQYLNVLQKYCTDRMNLIQAELPIVPDEIKYKAVATLHHCQEVSGEVQNALGKFIIVESPAPTLK